MFWTWPQYSVHLDCCCQHRASRAMLEIGQRESAPARSDPMHRVLSAMSHVRTKSPCRGYSPPNWTWTDCRHERGWLWTASSLRDGLDVQPALFDARFNIAPPIHCQARGYTERGTPSFESSPHYSYRPRTPHPTSGEGAWRLRLRNGSPRWLQLPTVGVSAPHGLQPRLG